MNRRDFLAVVSLVVAAWPGGSGRAEEVDPAGPADASPGGDVDRRFRRWMYGCGSDPGRNARDLKAAG
ncbi:MAG TPA: hypothetical protein PKX28_02335, partial [Candidatus Hydrogenedentes bacterium]|nr:hypothetical protein [Candidatus Hydrogenedentota bacterium]